MEGCDFSYNGKYLRDFGFIMVKPDTSDNSGLSRELLKSEFNSVRKEVNFYGAKYSDVIALNFLIIKDFRQKLDMDVKYHELRSIQSWITSSSIPIPFYVYFPDCTYIEYNGVFTNIEPFVVNGLNGFKLTFTCNSPFAYESKKIKINCGNDNSKTFSRRIDCNTDENDFVYPIITLTNIKNGNFKIQNNNDNNRYMAFTINSKYNQYIIDCKLKRILADDEILTMSDIGWETENIIDYNNINTGVYKAYWLRFVPKINELIIYGNADCLIEYKVPVKLGGFVYA